MASNQLSVTEVTSADEKDVPYSTGSRRSSLEVSRAQIGSGDGHRAPRRPSMTFQTTLVPSLPEVPVPSEHAHRENGYVQTGGQTTAHADRDRRGSVQRIRPFENSHERIRNQSSLERGHVRITADTLQVYDYQRRHYDHRHHHNDDPHYRDHHHHHYHHHHRDSSSDHRHRNDFRGISSAATYESAEMEDQRYVVPALPMPVAVMCCILNFLVPGLGSMTAGVCVLCCGDTEGMTAGEKCGSCCTVFVIGLLQMLLVVCFLVGWIWSCIWGVTFIGMSATYYDYDEQDFDDEQYYHHQSQSNNPVYNRDRARNQSTRLPTPQVVVDQPYPGVHYEDLIREQRRRRRRTASRRARSRISLTPGNLIYPMRAPSNVAYNSPPPPYPNSPPPVYTTQNRIGLPSVDEH